MLKAEKIVGLPKGPFPQFIYNDKNTSMNNMIYPLINYQYHFNKTKDKWYSIPQNTTECAYNQTSGKTNCTKDDFWEAAYLIFNAEFGDKTFLLLITFSLMWSSWKSDDA